MVTRTRQQKATCPPRMLLLTTLFQSLPCNWHYSFLWMPCATGGRRTDCENEKEQLAMEGREWGRKANCKASAAKQRRERRIYKGENGADDIKEEIPAKIDLASKSRWRQERVCDDEMVGMQVRIQEFYIHQIIFISHLSWLIWLLESMELHHLLTGLTKLLTCSVT